MRVKIPLAVTEDLAYETGLHIGDGSMNYYANHGLYSLRGGKNKDVLFFQEVVKPLYKKIYDANVNLRFWKDVYGFQISSDDLVCFKYDLGLPLGPKNDIEIPRAFTSDEALYTSCLRGLFETDGTVYLERKSTGLYPRIEFCTTSKPLASQVSALLSSLGFYFSARKHVYSNGWKPIYRFYLRGTRNLEKWVELIGFNHPRLLKKINTCLTENF